MIAWERAKQWQSEHDPEATFEELLGIHLSCGLVYATPNVFLLAGEMRWTAEEQQFENGEPNCWFVRLASAVGHANACGEFMRVFPHPHAYVAWLRGERDGRPRVFTWDKLLKATKR
jgi:hypothetical protein